METGKEGKGEREREREIIAGLTLLWRCTKSRLCKLNAFMAVSVVLARAGGSNALTHEYSSDCTHAYQMTNRATPPTHTHTHTRILVFRAEQTGVMTQWKLMHNYLLQLHQIEFRPLR